MEQLKLSEQDVVDALCMYMADQKSASPDQIEAELMYDDEKYGFSAEIFFNGRSQIIAHRDMVDAIRFWNKIVHNGNPYAGVELVLDDEEGIIAYIN